MTVGTPFHPSRTALIRFAWRDADVDRVRVARHLAACARCREFVGFSQRLTAAVAALDRVVLNDDVLTRALDDRRAGLRVILPSSDATRGRHRLIRRLMPALAVGGALVVFVFVWFASRRVPDFTSMNEFVLAGFTPRPAEARSMTGAGGVLRHRLAPMSLTFSRRVRPAAGVAWTAAGDLSARVTRDAGEDAWEVASSWSGIDGVAGMENARAWIETLHVAGPLLAPVSRSVEVVPYRQFAGISIRQEFRGDSVVGQMTLLASDTRRPIAHDLGPYRDRLVASDVLGPFFFLGVPLSPGASFDVGLLGWAVAPNDVILPLRVKVIGADSVDTPLGRFDCWKLAVMFDGRTGYHWVRRRDHLGILTRRELPDGSLREVALVRETQP